jgi:putative heme iron utilization protein
MTIHGTPSPANYVRSFVSFHKQATLSTHSKKHEGFPFGSVIPYDVDDDGRMIISVSLLSTHYKNLENSSKASLLIQQRYFEGRPRTGGRISLLLDFQNIPGEDYEQVAMSYRSRYGADAEFELAHDFVFKRGVVESVRWIAGFGRMGWLTGDEYRAGVADCITPAGLGAVEHMNDDHQDALDLLVRTHHADLDDTPPHKLQARMLSIDSLGFTLEFRAAGERKSQFVAFDPPLKNSDELRQRVVELVQQARSH